MSTPTSGGAGKICVVCGEDVASKPRTKDGKGHYYCQPCYDQAIAQKHAKRAAALIPKVTPGSRTKPPPIRDEAADDDAGHVLESLIDLHPAAPQLSMICPACHHTIPSGGVICTHCGYNVQTQDAVVPKVKIKLQRQAGGTLWPPIVGIISMALGASGALFYGAYAVLAFVRALNVGSLKAGLVVISPGTMLTALGAWLFRDGLRILRHDSEGVKWIRYWAMTKLLIYGTCLTFLMAAPPGPMEDFLSHTDTKLTVADVKSSILLVMLWYLAWPIFVMVFFFIPRVQEDVEAWG